MKFMKSILLLTVLLYFSSPSTTVSAQESKTLRFGHEIMDVQDAAFGTLYSVAIGEDIAVCLKYTQILGWNFVDAMKFFVELKWELAIINVGLVIHKSPLVYKQCLLILSDIEYIDAMFTLFNQGPFTFSLETQIVENLMFNFGDIMYNQILAKDAIAERNYTVFGETVARIVSDVFYINPTDQNVWSDINSLIIESSSSSLKVPSSFYNALTVQASNGLEDWAMEPVTALSKVGRVLDRVAAHQAPKIQDEKARTKREFLDGYMKMKTFGHEDVGKKPLTDVVMELSPKYYRKEQMKQAYK